MPFTPAFAPPAPATGAKPDTASAEISTDVSYLPDLTAYLDDLLRTRERLAAAIDGVDEWARADAMPAEEEITRVRHLVGRDQGRHRPGSATPNAPRSTRRSASSAVTARSTWGCHPSAPSSPRRERRPPHERACPPGPGGSPRTGAMMKGRQADSARRRQRVLAALNRAAADGAEISVSGIARAAAVDRTFLYRHRDLLGKIHALEAAAARRRRHRRPAVTWASLQADLLAAHERAVRLNARVRQLEKRLSEALGEQAWRESGLGAPADIDALNQQVTQLEQQAIDLRLQLEEQGQDLAAARAANRELMAQLNTTARHR